MSNKKPTYDELANALFAVANQHLELNGFYKHDFISSDEKCLEILKTLGFLKTEDDVIYQEV